MPKRCSRTGKPLRWTRLDRRTFLKGSAAATAGLLAASNPREARAQANPLVLDVINVPVPDFWATNRHPGVETMLVHLACHGAPFYRAPATNELSDPVTGMIARDDVVLIKVNGQWQYRGVTNSDVVRGMIQRILDHPEGFVGEVVIFENGQGQGSLNCDKSWTGTYPDNLCHANAEDEGHSFQYLIDVVFGGDPRVSGYLLDPIRTTWIAADEHVQDGYRDEGYVSYPCFTTSMGRRVELKEGIWDGAGYRQNLKWINIPVFKHHGGSAITGALKHVYGILSMDHSQGGYHYGRIGDATGEVFSRVRAPVLNVVDCIWVSPVTLRADPNRDLVVRTDRLVAGFDPVALDYYAGKYILHPVDPDPDQIEYHNPDSSADYIAFLSEATACINANGGIGGMPVTYDEAEFNVQTADAAHPETPVGNLRVTREGLDVRLTWEGGTPPYRVYRSDTPDPADRRLLDECCMERFYVDPLVAGDEASYYYTVE